MSAKDALNPRLFHGSRHLLQPGDILQNTTPGYGTDELHSFATDNPENAAQYGGRVYEVSPESQIHSDPYNDDPDYGNPGVKNFSSSKFVIVKEV